MIDISDHNPCFTTSNDVAELCASLRNIGIDYFDLSRVDNSGGRIYLSNKPLMLKHYLDGHYYLQGNTEGDPQNYKPQVVLWETLENQSIYDQVTKPFNVEHGMYIIEPKEDYCDFFNFAPINGTRNIINTYLSHMEYLKNFTREFTARAAKLIQTVGEKKLFLPFNEKLIDLTRITPFDNDVGTIETPQQQIKITVRQYEIAKKLLQGKLTKQIAADLNISPRTVETHFIHIKNKLNCSNRTEVILKLAKII